MAEWTVIIKNVSGSDQWLTDFGTIVLSGGQVDLTEIATYDEIGGSRDLKDKITNDIFIVNDGAQDLDKDSSMDFVTLENLDDLYDNFYTQNQLASGGGAAVHWDNVTDAPAFGSATWKDPVLVRALEITTPAPTAGMVEGDWYVDTSDDVIYQYVSSTWTASLTAESGDRVIDLSDDNVRSESIFVLSGGSWSESGDPDDGDAVVVLNDSSIDNQAQYIYEEGQEKWVKIGDVDFGPHLDGGPNKHDASEIDVEGTYTNVTGQTDLETTISSIDTAIGQNASDISDNATDIGNNTIAIGNNTTAINNNAIDIAQNTSDIASLSGDIANIEVDITNIETDVTALSAAIDTNTTDIGENATDITALSAAIDVNSTDIEDNNTDIAALSADLAANYTEHVALSAAIDGNTTDIGDISTDITSLSAAIDTNITNIEDNSTDITALSAAIDDNYTEHVELSGAIDDNITDIAALSAAIDDTEAGHNSLDEAYDHYGAGLGRTIYTDAGSMQLSASDAGYAPLELTPQAAAPTQGLAAGQMSVINGILCVYDDVRAKWLSVQRVFVAFGKDGQAKSSYMKYYGGGSTSNLSGIRLVRNATVVSMAGQLDSYVATENSTFHLRSNDLLTNIVGSDLLMNAVGVSDTTIDVDLSANDFLQCWFDVPGSYNIKNPLMVMEIAWRF